MTSPIDVLYEEQRELVMFLESADQTSLALSAQSMHAKALVLAAASFFEHELQRILVRFAHSRTNGDEALSSFFKKKAIDRQYHTYFSWESANANQFFGLFGSTIGDACKREAKEPGEVRDSVQAFVELGKTRNELVHLNYVTFPVEKTHAEIYDLYRRAAPFPTWLAAKLGCDDRPLGGGPQ